MFCVSLSYKNASIDIREKLSLTNSVLNEIGTGVLLSTCNRIELYGTADLYSVVEKYFGEHKNYLLIYENEKAIRHLFRVACGLDSLVIGEDEILRQVKTAFSYSLDNGYTDYELNTIFKAAITCAKRIKTDTLLSKSSISVATLASSACSKYKNGKKTVLVIGGSGEIGNRVIQDLVSIGDFEIYATVREHRVKNCVKLIDYKERYDYLKAADIVISATKSPHFTITKNSVDNKKRLYVDLAVPRDIDPAISNIITIDDLKTLAKQNNEIKQGEVQSAEEMINEETEKLLKELAFHSLMPLEKSDELMHFIYRFRDAASADEFQSFTNVVQRMGAE